MSFFDNYTKFYAKDEIFYFSQFFGMLIMDYIRKVFV